jgi:hypothetical protein
MAAHVPPPSHATRRWAPAAVTPEYRTVGAVYRPRRPTATPLYPVVQHHLESFLAVAEEVDPVGWGVPAWVEKDFRRYLACGVLAHGFARVRCGDCGQERLLAFSCKGRGVCPSCNARRMAEVAAHLTDYVLPHLPIRQWVLVLPKRLRPFLHGSPELASAVLAIFLRALRATLRKTSPTAPRGSEVGAISFPQRFGNSLNPHYHFHVLAVDGVFSEARFAEPGSEAGGPAEVRFHQITGLGPEHWEELARLLQHRVLRAFRRRGLLADAAAADMLTWQGAGGFSVDASVRIEGDDRAGLERDRLHGASGARRYCARGPLALERLHAPEGSASLASPDARLVYRLPAPDPNGRTELWLTPMELLERLARLVPPPRIHRHRYHGVLAPHAGLRSAVVALGRPVPEEAGLSRPSEFPGSAATRPASTPTPAGRGLLGSLRMSWAQLLARIYEVLPLLCPACGGEMKVISFITDPSTVQTILLHLELPHRPPRVSPARAPPQTELSFDQTPTFDPSDPEPAPEPDFDQSPRDDWDA